MNKLDIAPQPAKPITQFVLGTLLLTCVFVFDLNQPLGVAAGIPYAALVLVGVILHSKIMILSLAVMGTVLTIVGLYFQQAEVALQIVMTNRILAIILVWATALICMRQLTFQDQISEAMFRKKHDPLTALPNRMDLFDRGEKLFRSARSSEQNLCLIAFGIDNLQELTEQYGTLAADAVTQNIAQLFNNRQQQHYVASLASGVFVLILPRVNLKFATQYSKTLMQDAADLKTEWQGEIIHCSLSAGLCQLKDEMPGIVEFFQTADHALRAAKKEGKNQLLVVS